MTCGTCTHTLQQRHPNVLLCLEHDRLVKRTEPTCHKYHAVSELQTLATMTAQHRARKERP